MSELSIPDYRSKRQALTPELQELVGQIESVRRDVCRNVLLQYWKEATILADISKRKEDLGLASLKDLAGVLSLSPRTLHTRLKVAETFSEKEIETIAKEENGRGEAMLPTFLDQLLLLEKKSSRNEAIRHWRKEGPGLRSFTEFVQSKRLEETGELDEPDAGSGGAADSTVRLGDLCKSVTKQAVKFCAALSLFDSLELADSWDADSLDAGESLRLQLKTANERVTALLRKLDSLDSASDGPSEDVVAAAGPSTVLDAILQDAGVVSVDEGSSLLEAVESATSDDEVSYEDADDADDADDAVGVADGAFGEFEEPTVVTTSADLANARSRREKRGKAIAKAKREKGANGKAVAVAEPSSAAAGTGSSKAATKGPKGFRNRG